MDKKKRWSIKRIKNKYYLYTWEYDFEASQKKKQEMLEHIENGNEKGYTKRDVQTKSSCYKWRSLGRLNFDKPSKKLSFFFQTNHEEVIKVIQALNLKKSGI